MTRPAWIAMVLLVSGWSWIDRPVPEVDEGNRAFAAGNFHAARAAYYEALREGSEPEVHLNLGLALYQLARLARGAERDNLLSAAESSLSLARGANRARLRSDALTALGNLYYHQEALEDAVAAYREALIQDPGNDKARWNLELSSHRLRARSEATKEGAGDHGDDDLGEAGSGGDPAGQGDGTGAGDTDPAAGHGQGAEAGAGQARETRDGGDGSQSEDGRPVDGDIPPLGAGLDDGGSRDGGDRKIATDIGDLQRKLDALERRSRRLRKQLFKGRPGESASREGPDW